MVYILKSIHKEFDIIVRNATKSDAPKIGELLYSNVFDEIWDSESIELETDRWKSRLNTLPECVIIAEDEKSGEVVGASACQYINWNYGDDLQPWVEITDNGYIAKSHIPNGNTRHLVTCAAHKGYPRLNIGQTILNAQVELFNKGNQKYFIVGHTVGRSNQLEFLNYRKFIGKESGMSYKELERKITEWINAKNSKNESADGLTRFYQRAGFQFVRILKNYEGYPEYNHSVLQACKNNGYS